MLALLAAGAARGAPPPDLAAARAAVAAEDAARAAVFERVTPTVVCIFDNPQRSGGGSGVLIDSEGYGLTNYHVVAGMLAQRKGVGGLSDGKLYPLRVLGIDPGGDIAMFRLEGREKFDAAPLADSDECRVGQWAAAIGNPFLLAEEFSPTITLGIISGLHRYQVGQENLLEYADCIQVSSSINPGNSGGPLFDLAGRVIGINGRGSFEERGRVNVGLGYAVSINQVKRFIPALRAGLLCEHGTLGATVQRIGDELIFDAVQDVAPAQRAGVALGDELIALDERPMRTANDYNNYVATLPADWPLVIRFRHKDEERTATARLERMSARLEQPFIPDRELNVAELVRVWQRFRRADLRAADGLRWTGVLPGEIVVGSEPPAPFRQEIGATHLPSDGPVGANVADGPHVDLRGEFAAIVAALLHGPDFAVSWSISGVDRVAGRLAVVAEFRRGAEGRWRWKFDTETGEFVEATTGDARDCDQVRWRPGERVEDAGLRFPRDWTRTAGEATARVSLGRPEPSKGDSP